MRSLAKRGGKQVDGLPDRGRGRKRSLQSSPSGTKEDRPAHWGLINLEAATGKGNNRFDRKKSRISRRRLTENLKGNRTPRGVRPRGTKKGTP